MTYNQYKSYEPLLAKYLIWYVDEEGCYYNSWQEVDCLFDTWEEADAYAKELVLYVDFPANYKIDTFAKHFEEDLIVEETA